MTTLAANVFNVALVAIGVGPLLAVVFTLLPLPAPASPPMAGRGRWSGSTAELNIHAPSSGSRRILSGW